MKTIKTIADDENKKNYDTCVNSKDILEENERNLRMHSDIVQFPSYILFNKVYTNVKAQDLFDVLCNNSRDPNCNRITTF